MYQSEKPDLLRQVIRISFCVIVLLSAPISLAQSATMREQLGQLKILLEQAEQPNLVQLVERALAGPDTSLDQFLVSNELWGGSGSIADSAGITAGGVQKLRKELEDKLIEIGRMQMQSGAVNPRTEMWVTTFEYWRDNGFRK